MTTVTPGEVTPPEFDAKVDQLAKLLGEIREVKVDQGRSWKWLKRGGGFIAFDVVVTILGLLAGLALWDQQGRIDTTIHETCSLYSLFINSYNPASAAKSPLGPEQYNIAFRQLQVSADNLDCHIKHKL